jgi:glutamate 5-kinase
MRTTMTGETAAQPMERKELAKAKRIVIKVGTSSLTTNYRLDPAKVEKLTTEIVALKQQGKEVILVTSGAIGAGIGKLDLKQRPRDMKVLQATAAVGQNILMSTYDHYFAEHGQTIAQILLTHGAFFNRQRYLNLRNTLSTLLKFGVIPIINENDTVAVDEIKLGDNDNLSALVASNLGADLLIILTDTEGLYTHNPQRDKNAQLIPVVTEITPEIEQTAGKGRKAGVGGMTTKLQAAKVVMQAGIPLVIANSREERILLRILEGERIGTLFLPEKKAMNGRRHWIGFAATPKGKIMVDDGAKRALIENGVSLLASGITGVEKTFKSGETVSIVDAEGVEFARGISNYASSEIELIKGAQSREIKQILGRKGYTEVVYRGNMVLL